jgi:hypothetical protein
MTKDNWLTVAMIIAVIITAAATLVGPALAVIVQERISQPKPTPETNQPKNLNQRIGGLFRIWLWEVMLVLSLSWSGFIFVISLRRFKEGVTAWSVFLIAYSVGTFYYGFIMYYLMRTSQKINDAINELRNLKQDKSDKTV